MVSFLSFQVSRYHGFIEPPDEFSDSQDFDSEDYNLNFFDSEDYNLKFEEV